MLLLFPVLDVYIPLVSTLCLKWCPIFWDSGLTSPANTKAGIAKTMEGGWMMLQAIPTISAYTRNVCGPGKLALGAATTVGMLDDNWNGEIREWIRGVALISGVGVDCIVDSL